MHSVKSLLMSNLLAIYASDQLEIRSRESKVKLGDSTTNM